MNSRIHYLVSSILGVATMILITLLLKSFNVLTVSVTCYNVSVLRFHVTSH